MSNKMKTIKIKILTLAIFSALLLAFSGCYTILWTPEDEMPEERPASGSTSSEESSYNPVDTYYSPASYGGYSDYYYQPWWHKVTLPTASHIVNQKGTNVGQTTDSQGRSIRNTENSGVPSAGHVSGSSSGSAGSSNAAPKKEERKRDETTNSNTNTKTESSPSRDSNSDSNSLRNSDSNRSTDKGRR